MIKCIWVSCKKFMIKFKNIYQLISRPHFYASSEGLVEGFFCHRLLSKYWKKCFYFLALNCYVAKQQVYVAHLTHICYMSGRRGAGGIEGRNIKGYTNMLLNFYSIILVSFKAVLLWNERYSFLKPASLRKQTQPSDRASWNAEDLSSIKQSLLVVLSRSQAETQFCSILHLPKVDYCLVDL